MKNDPDKGIDINTILKFNKVKQMLEGLEEEKQLSFIRKTINDSKNLKIKENKITRIEKFDKNKIDTQQFDNKTVYIENLPNNISHENLRSIFKDYGRILHTSIPKFSRTKETKGFAFIIFEKEENARHAILTKNNTIPAEVIENNASNSESLFPLKIMSKSEWLEQKKEFKKLKQELMRENKDIFTECFAQDSKQLTNLASGTLIKLENIPVSKKLDKNSIKAWVSHIIEPAYVDHDSNKPTECIIRFSHKFMAEYFLNKMKNEDILFYDTKIKVSPIIGKEERNYFEMIESKRKSK